MKLHPARCPTGSPCTSPPFAIAFPLEDRMAENPSKSTVEETAARDKEWLEKTYRGGAEPELTFRSIILGALIGAIAGGGKGAAIGTAVGAGSGAAVQVITHGDQVKIPPETKLEFTLRAPLTVRK